MEWYNTYNTQWGDIDLDADTVLKRMQIIQDTNGDNFYTRLFFDYTDKSDDVRTARRLNGQDGKGDIILTYSNERATMESLKVLVKQVLKNDWFDLLIVSGHARQVELHYRSEEVKRLFMYEDGERLVWVPQTLLDNPSSKMPSVIPIGDLQILKESEVDQKILDNLAGLRLVVINKETGESAFWLKQKSEITPPSPFNSEYSVSDMGEFVGYGPYLLESVYEVENGEFKVSPQGALILRVTSSDELLSLMIEGQYLYPAIIDPSILMEKEIYVKNGEAFDPTSNTFIFPTHGIMEDTDWIIYKEQSTSVYDATHTHITPSVFNTIYGQDFRRIYVR